MNINLVGNDRDDYKVMKENNNLYKVAVVATMSSGKSTFINSLLGKEILASRNTACTTKIIEIFNKENYGDFKAEVFSNGNKKNISINDSFYIDEFNNNKIENINIIGEFYKIKNIDKNLVLIDTPGVNNSLDSTHMQCTYNFLNKFDEGMIIYIINATQFGINDDFEFLSYVSNIIKSNKNLKLIILVNKIDEIDTEKESIDELLKSVQEYILNIGIKNTRVIPISTLSALLFRRVISGNGHLLTRKELKSFYRSYEFWTNQNNRERKLSVFTNKECKNKKVFFNDEEFNSIDLERAIENTGITLVESLISEALKSSYESGDYEKNLKPQIRERLRNSCDNKVDESEIKHKKVKETYKNVKNQEFDINVLATMNSGKSTLINSMIGLEILPSANEACTATITRIKSSDNNGIFVTCKDKNGKIIYKKSEADLEKIKKYNEDEDVTYIDIECKMDDISSKTMNLVLVDTPGPNNPRNINHREITKSVINDKNKSVVLYVMNATQLSISDDKELLTSISDAMKRGGKQARDRFIFVINKCDELDSEKGEPLDKIIHVVREYLSEFEIYEPNIFPVTAQLAKVIRMNQKEKNLTRSEKKKLNEYDDYIEYEDLHFDKFASLSLSCRRSLEERIKKAKEEGDDYQLALIHSGVPAVEEAIKEYLNKYAYPIKIEQAIEGFMSIIREKEMMTNLDETLVKSKDEQQRLKEQINSVKEKLRKGNKVKEIKKKINSFNKIDEEIFDEVEKEIINKMVYLSKSHHDKNSIEKYIAEREINRFKKEIEKIVEESYVKLERAINISVIEEGEKLLVEYEDYLGDLKDELNVGGFTFEKVSIVKDIKINNIDDLINKNSKTEDVYETKIIKAKKSFWNPFSWFKEDEIVEEKVGEETYVNVGNVVSVSMGEIKLGITKNINSAREEAKKEVRKLMNHFKKELDKLDELIKEIVEDIESKTKTEEIIKQRVEENKKAKIWLEDIINQLNNIMQI